jgi:hypothetical protein
VTTVYLLWHGGSEAADDPLLIGVYSSFEKAREAQARSVVLEGFRDWPDRFEIVDRELDQDGWTEGFVTD